jgi:hypothetical protein
MTSSPSALMGSRTGAYAMFAKMLEIGGPHLTIEGPAQ